jgi:hypothetical protein
VVKGFNITAGSTIAGTFGVEAIGNIDWSSVDALRGIEPKYMDLGGGKNFNIQFATYPIQDYIDPADLRNVYGKSFFDFHQNLPENIPYNSANIFFQGLKSVTYLAPDQSYSKQFPQLMNSRAIISQSSKTSIP